MGLTRSQLISKCTGWSAALIKCVKGGGGGGGGRAGIREAQVVCKRLVLVLSVFVYRCVVMGTMSVGEFMDLVY